MLLQGASCCPSPAALGTQAKVPNLWRQLQAAAKEAEQTAPNTCQVATAKWGYTCGTHIISNHLFSCSFAALPRVPHQLQALLTGCQPEPPCPLPAPNCDWFTLPEDAFLAAPRLLNHTMSSLHTIYNEMRLPPDARAGSKAVAAPTVHPVTSVLTARDLVLSKTLKQHRHKAALSLSATSSPT